MQCQQPGGCTNAFHVLCARNIGLYLSERSAPGWRGRQAGRRQAGAQACCAALVLTRLLSTLALPRSHPA